jgi:hypothetical protein
MNCTKLHKNIARLCVFFLGGGVLFVDVIYARAFHFTHYIDYVMVNFFGCFQVFALRRPFYIKF